MKNKIESKECLWLLQSLPGCYYDHIIRCLVADVLSGDRPHSFEGAASHQPSATPTRLYSFDLALLPTIILSLPQLLLNIRSHSIQFD